MFTIGRILFALFFVVSGAYRWSDLANVAQAVSGHIALPTEAATYTAQLESMTGLPLAQLIVIAASALEIVCGVMIALNFGSRVFAIVLAAFVLVTIFYFNDFWSAGGTERIANGLVALRKLAFVGGLLMIAGYPRLPADLSSTSYDRV